MITVRPLLVVHRRETTLLDESITDNSPGEGQSWDAPDFARAYAAEKYRSFCPVDGHPDSPLPSPAPQPQKETYQSHGRKHRPQTW